MCLILFSWKQHPKYKLILAANRDEFYDRPTAQADFWEDQPEILAGRDLQANGTWIGISKSGRLAALTNYRDPQNIDSNAPSRGQLTTNFLIGQDSPEQYLRKIKNSDSHYNGFNLMVGDADELFHYNNVNHDIQEVESGLYGLSNGFFQEKWPKIKIGSDALEQATARPNISSNALLKILSNKQISPDSQLPKTGVPLDWERALSPLFIETEKYGTRCSTIILKDHSNATEFTEKTYAVGGQQESTVTYKI